MNLKELLQAFSLEKLINEDGEVYRIALKPGLTPEQISAFEGKLPGPVPAEIRELLTYSSGFNLEGFGEINFCPEVDYGPAEFFNYSFPLAEDGCGNFWVTDIDKQGNWCHVFYVCHDPPVITKTSENLQEFLEQLHQSARDQKNSWLNKVHDHIVFETWHNNPGFIDRETVLASGDTVLKDFAFSLPGNYVFADLRNAPNGKSFSWGNFSWKSDIIKHPEQYIWAVEVIEKKGFLERVKGWFGKGENNYA